MKQNLPWNVTGIPPEARDAARSAAGREGLSVGDWLTRRILGETARTLGATERLSEETAHAQFRVRDEEARRDREDLVMHVSRTEVEAESAFRRIDEALRSMTRRLETTERSQNDTSRTLSAAAQEINSAAREQAHAFDALTERLDRVERNADSGALRDAVRGLHQGLSRLADQIARTATESTSNIEALANKLLTVRDEAHDLTRSLESRLDAIDQRVYDTENRVPPPNPLEGKVGPLEEKIATLEAQTQGVEGKLQEALGRHLAAIERNLETIAARLDKAEARGSDSDGALQDTLQTLTQRLEASEKRNREALSELRSDLSDTAKRLNAIAAPPPMMPELVPDIGAPAALVQPAASNADFDLPPFPEMPPFPETPSFSDAPPFPANAFSGSPTPDYAPLPDMEPSDIYTAEPETPQPGPVARDYLAAARRAAQATAEVDATRGRGRGRKPKTLSMGDVENRRVPVVAGILGLILLAALAGYLLTRGSFETAQIAHAPVDQLPPPSGTATKAPEPTGSASATTTTTTTAPAAASPYGADEETPDGENPTGEGNEPITQVYKAPPTPPGAIAERAAPRAGVTPAPAVTPPPQSVMRPQTNNAPVAMPAPGFTPAPTVAGPAPSGPSAPTRAGVSPLDRLLSQAKAGDARAQLVLGLKYLDGDGVAASDSEAMRWLRKASEQGKAWRNIVSARCMSAAAVFPPTPSKRSIGIKRPPNTATARPCTISPSPMPKAPAWSATTPPRRAGSARRRILA